MTSLAVPEDERRGRAVNGTIEQNALIQETTDFFGQQGDASDAASDAHVPRWRSEDDELGRRRRGTDRVLDVADVDAAVGRRDAFDAQTGAALGGSDAAAGHFGAVGATPLDVRRRVAADDAFQDGVFAHQRRYVHRRRNYHRTH